MTKHKCEKCHQPITDKEFIQYKALCESCMAHEIQKMRQDAKRDIDKSLQ